MKIKVYFVFLFLLMTTLHPAKLTLKDKNSSIKINSGTGFSIENSITGLKGKIIKDENAELLGTTVTFSEGKLKVQGNETKLTGLVDLVNNWIELSNGQEFSSKYGKISQKIKVNGKNNIVSGGVKLENDIELQDADSELEINLVNGVDGNIYLNGGELNLKGNLKLSDEKRVVGPGKISLNGNSLSFGAKDLVWNENVLWHDASDVQLCGNLELNGTFTFDGSSILSGNGNILCLRCGGDIVVHSNSTLWLKDITVKAVSGNNIRCVADNSAIVMQNVRWIQSGNFTFTKGSMQFLEKVKMMGGKTFEYQSNMTSTVMANSELVLDLGFTFSYKPMVAKKDLLYFDDDTAVFELNGASFGVSSTGICLERGTLKIKGSSYLHSDASIRSEGIMFGDGLIATNDMDIEVFAGATIELCCGYAVYNNVS